MKEVVAERMQQFGQPGHAGDCGPLRVDEPQMPSTRRGALVGRASSAPEVALVLGARPNFVKLAPLYDALVASGRVRLRLLHTGQHYDWSLSGSFLAALGLPEPDVNLAAGSGTHAEQTAAVLVGTERALREQRPHLVVVAGDVNSTLAAALAAAKLQVPVAHLEAGLRSGDWSMPEEVNRVLTDRLAGLLLCPGEDAVDNLAAEGITGDGVALVGNTMIDSLYRLRDAAARRDVLTRLAVQPERFVLVTLHRPALVDDARRLAAVVAVLQELARELPVIFPLHPRTRARIGTVDDLVLVDPLDYLDFVALEAAARLVVTDSGGVQEETSALGVPCLTYRTTTERPITIDLGTNRLVGVDPDELRVACAEALARPARPAHASIPLWDGQAGPRAAAAVLRMLFA
jgi:UDP-N-acetylglucosamine 2-epimerase (non-hydrolysing)